MQMIISIDEKIYTRNCYICLIFNTQHGYEASVEATKMARRKRDYEHEIVHRKTQHICCRSKSSRTLYSTWMLRDNGTSFSVVVNERIVIHLGARDDY